MQAITVWAPGPLLHGQPPPHYTPPRQPLLYCVQGPPLLSLLALSPLTKQVVVVFKHFVGDKVQSGLIVLLILCLSLVRVHMFMYMPFKLYSFPLWGEDRKSVTTKHFTCTSLHVVKIGLAFCVDNIVILNCFEKSWISLSRMSLIV